MEFGWAYCKLFAVGDVAERPNALVLKTSEGHTSAGSNPAVSA